MKTSNITRMGIMSLLAAVFLACNSENIATAKPVAPETSDKGSNGEIDGITNSTNVYSRTSLISDVMADSVFGSYGRLLFPVQRGYWSGETLEKLHLTYYNYIDPDETVAIVNYLHNQAKDNQTSYQS